MIIIAIVEDEKSARDKLVRSISHTSGFKVAGAFESKEALNGLKASGAGVILMSLAAIKATSFDLVRRVRKELPSAQVVIRSPDTDAQAVLGALKAGAAGYIMARAPVERLVSAIRDVAGGGGALCSFAVKQMAEFLEQEEQSSGDRVPLSRRQGEILQLASLGRHNKDIATKLGISTETVRVHLRQVYKKLEVQSRSQAVVKYLAG
jgi:DNA-binding NarL/FixJ family response regulator